MSYVSPREWLTRKTPQKPSIAPQAAPTPALAMGDPARQARFGHRLADLNVFPEGAEVSESATTLPDALQRGMESLSGLSLDAVQVHRDSPRPADVGALAFAQDAEIHLGPRQEQHLAHEAWHVVQQKQGRAAGLQAKGESGAAGGILEAEADAVGALAMGAVTGAGGALAGAGGMLAGAESMLVGGVASGAPAQAAAKPPTAAELAELKQRQLDRKKMEGMLKVVPDDSDAKTRKPNEVTQAEFDKYAGMYSDIRSDKASLKIDKGVDEKHKGAMLDDIAKILQTKSGRSMVGDLSAGGKDKEVVLGLSKNDDGSLNKLGAETASNDYYAGADKTKGTGSNINYIPGAEGEFTKGRNEIKGADGKVMQAYDLQQKFTSDTVLFHEMTHAWHNATGTAKKVPWPAKGEAGETVSQADADAEVKAGHAGAAKDVGIAQEEWATAGMGKFHDDKITENAYRAEQRTLTGDTEGYAERTRYTADQAPLVLPPPAPLPPVRHEEDEK
jgi:hypothetical protein